MKRTLMGLSAASLLAGPVFGHAKLLSTMPAADARLTASPASLTLTFNEAVRLAMLQVTSSGREVAMSVDRAAAAAATVAVPLPRLASGTYEVRWSALTPSDGHVVKGTFSFVVR